MFPSRNIFHLYGYAYITSQRVEKNYSMQTETKTRAGMVIFSFDKIGFLLKSIVML